MEMSKKKVIALLALVLVAVICEMFGLSQNKIKVAGAHNQSACTFACAVSCMDGRVQDAVKNFVTKRYGVDYVDEITEPGPNKILADNTNKPIIENIKKRVNISVEHHKSKAIAIVGHYGCAGNPVEKEEQIKHLKDAKKVIQSFGFDAEIILLWVEKDWKTVEVIE